MDRLRLEAEYYGARRVDDLRQQAESRRLVAAAEPPMESIAVIAARLGARFAIARAVRRHQRTDGAANHRRTTFAAPWNAGD